MRLIDANAVIAEQRRIMGVMYGNTAEELKKHLEIDDELSVPIHAMEMYSRAKQFYYGLKGILENAPTIDAVLVVHGRWEYSAQTIHTQSLMRCSICGWWTLDPSVDGAYHYCPHCGAKMGDTE